MEDSSCFSGHQPAGQLFATRNVYILHCTSCPLAPVNQSSLLPGSGRSHNTARRVREGGNLVCHAQVYRQVVVFAYRPSTVAPKSERGLTENLTVLIESDGSHCYLEQYLKIFMFLFLSFSFVLSRAVLLLINWTGREQMLQQGERMCCYYEGRKEGREGRQVFCCTVMLALLLVLLRLRAG